jgi:uncharacterized protein YecT (DUF1311 family)
MRKFIKSIIFIVVLFALFLVGCTTNLNKKEEQPNEEENTSISSEKIENNIDTSNEDDGVSSSNEKENNSTPIDSMKQIYLEKLNKLEADLDETLIEKYASPKTQDMIDAANKEYTEWDNMLNDIYTELQNQLSIEEIDQLRDSELNWIENRDKKSQESHEQFKGGTIASLNAIKSLANSTKSRCYELVNQYMK